MILIRWVGGFKKLNDAWTDPSVDRRRPEHEPSAVNRCVTVRAAVIDRRRGRAGE
jgi:hypothetical protein